MPAAITRADVSERVEAVLNRGGWGNPDVLLVRGDSGVAVVKDFAPRSAVVRNTWGRWMIRREQRAHARLVDIDCVPALFGAVDGLAYAMEYRPGIPLGRSLAEVLPVTFMPDLSAAISQLHERGVVHLDLRHRSNVLADAQGRPVVIDFGASICLDPKRAAARWLIRALGGFDHRALRKWRMKLAQPDVSPVASSGPGNGSEGSRGANRPM